MTKFKKGMVFRFHPEWGCGSEYKYTITDVTEREIICLYEYDDEMSGEHIKVENRYDIEKRRNRQVAYTEHFCLDSEWGCDKDDDGRYTPSSTAGDYSPSCPWKAPGMSIRDFI